MQVIIAVILSGILSWLSLAIEYLIISWAERVSDQANEQNRISSATLLFVILGTILYIISAAVGSYAVWDNGKHLTNGTTLLLVLRAVVLVTATAAFVKKNIVKKTAYIYPTIVLLSSVVIHIWAMLSNFGQQIAYVVFSILAILLSIIIAIGYRTGKKASQ